MHYGSDVSVSMWSWLPALRSEREHQVQIRRKVRHAESERQPPPDQGCWKRRPSGISLHVAMPFRSVCSLIKAATARSASYPLRTKVVSGRDRRERQSLCSFPCGRRRGHCVL